MHWHEDLATDVSEVNDFDSHFIATSWGFTFLCSMEAVTGGGDLHWLKKPSIAHLKHLHLTKRGQFNLNFRVPRSQRILQVVSKDIKLGKLER
jgi:hypothetical protein